MTEHVEPQRAQNRAPSAPVAPTAREEAATEQAFRALHVGYALLPIVAGADKFFNVLIDWEDYLSPQFTRALPGNPGTIMRGVGVVEMAAGVLTAARPNVGGYVVSAWLGGIVLNYVLQDRYRDVALRDVGLMIGAFALGRMADARTRRERVRRWRSDTA